MFYNSSFTMMNLIQPGFMIIYSFIIFTFSCPFKRTEHICVDP